MTGGRFQSGARVLMGVRRIVVYGAYMVIVPLWTCVCVFTRGPIRADSTSVRSENALPMAGKPPSTTMVELHEQIPPGKNRRSRADDKRATPGNVSLNLTGKPPNP